MQALHKKLHSRRGASILMALLLLLVAVMVSAVIIASAVSSAMTVKSDRLQQQAYLTVSSAAKLMRDDLANCGYEHVVTKSYSSDYNRSNDSDGNIISDKTTSGNGTFAEIISDAISQVDTYAKAFDEKYIISAGGFDDVTAEITLEKDSKDSSKYNLTVLLTGGTEPNECRMYLTASGNINTGFNDTTGEEKVIDYSYYSYYYGETIYVYKQQTVYLRETTTTLAWDNAKLSK